MVDLKVMAYFKISLSTRNWDRAFFLLVDGQWPDGRALWLILYAGIPTSALSPWLWMQGIALLGANCSGLIIPDTILGGTVATMT
ncbi:hypothetical protein VAWG002_21870 [Aeromonas veronii]|nr:hypothetical protein VAWG002_21870 [Aeromonas veronii]